MPSSFSFDYVTLKEEGSMILQTGRDSSVGIATRYVLDGPRIESRWGQDFPHLSELALGPTQPPIQWVPGISQG
jgi:hypothetical protein